MFQAAPAPAASARHQKRIRSYPNIHSLVQMFDTYLAKTPKSPTGSKTEISYKCLSRFDIIIMTILKGSQLLTTPHSVNSVLTTIMKQKQESVLDILHDGSNGVVDLTTTWLAANQPHIDTINNHLYMPLDNPHNHNKNTNTLIGLDGFDNPCFKYTFHQHINQRLVKFDILITNLLPKSNKHLLFNIDNMNMLMESHLTTSIRQTVGCWKGVSFPECYIDLDASSVNQLNVQLESDDAISIKTHYLEISRHHPFKITKHKTTNHTISSAPLSTPTQKKQYKKFHAQSKHLNFIEVFINDMRILGTIHNY